MDDINYLLESPAHFAVQLDLTSADSRCRSVLQSERRSFRSNIWHEVFSYSLCMSPPFISFWQRIFFSMAYGTMTWISSERIQPKHRKQEGTFLEGPTAIHSGAVAQSKSAPVNWRWSGRPQSSRGPVEDGSDMMGWTFSFLFTRCVLMVEMVELPFHWVVQFRSVFKSIFICSFKDGTSIKMTDLYRPSFWYHSTRIWWCRDRVRRIRINPSKRSGDSLTHHSEALFLSS